WLREAEELQAERQPEYPRLYSLWGFRYCDLLLAEVERAAWRSTLVATSFQPVEKQPVSWKLATTDQIQLQSVCADVTQRAKQTLGWAEQGRLGLLTVALDHLTLARTAFYAALLHPSSGGFRRPARHETSACDAAVDGLRQSGNMDFLPRGLLT